VAQKALGLRPTELNTNRDLDSALENGSRASRSLLFHEPWWLSAAAGDEHIDLSVFRGNDLSGRLPLVRTRSRLGFRILRMPSLTHVLGPAIESGRGKRQKRLANRLSIVRDLLDQLPTCDFCQVTMDPSLDDGLALADGLAFQERGFRVSPQYTFQVDGDKTIAEIWNAMDIKVRRPIRRAEERYKIAEIDNPHIFIDFYLRNLHKQRRKNYVNFDRFPLLFSESRARNCGLILATLLPDGSPTAMAFIVWGHGSLYYMLSTRVPDAPENGCVNVLIWSAIKKAQELGLICDLDGIISQGAARFLSGFGGKLRFRLIATYYRPLYGAIKGIQNQVDPIENKRFRF
jgi:Acetyltransferase (GNAT) domain